MQEDVSIAAATTHMAESCRGIHLVCSVFIWHPGVYVVEHSPGKLRRH
jgi:hypothetical protein